MNNHDKNKDSLLLKAYNLGWNYCLWGDEQAALDELSDEEILQHIKGGYSPRIRQTEWEKAERNPMVPLPLRLQEKYQKAIRFAGEQHQDQKIPSSKSSYIVHVSNVAMEILLAYFEKPDFDINFAVQLALLHDVLEDTDCIKNDLQEHFDRKTADAVEALSKDKSIRSKKDRMDDSLARIRKLCKEVGMVKIADRITNLQSPPKHWSKVKIREYQEEACRIHKQLKDCNQYLANRLYIKAEVYKGYF